MAREREFPKLLARFDKLEGGQFGEVILKALTRHRMELELGDDFVTFTRVQAEALREAVTRFLDLECEEERRREHREERREEREERAAEQAVEHVVEEVAQEVAREISAARPRRKRR